jgi:hypothetical protein
MFEILSQFIEKECEPEEIIDWDASGHTIKYHGKPTNVRKVMQELYDWWHNDYNKLRKEKEDEIWNKVVKYMPKPSFVEKEDGIFTLNTKYKSSWYKKQYKKYSKLNIKLEYDYHKMLIENMKTLCELMPYMWT